jgi:tetratricopeptide (TPR) repeat protein
MTNPSLEAPLETVSFDERIEMLAKELELAVKWQRPCILLVVYSSEYVRRDVETELENYLFDLGQKTVRLRIQNDKADGILSFFKGLKDPAHAVFFVDGLHWGEGEEMSNYSALNLQREFCVERQIRTVFWLTKHEIVNLAHFAPDFWAYRHRVIEFVDSPKADRLLRQALEFAWQGTGEYADEYQDTDAKISLREALLTELPQGEEACSTRANLLLTLGVLNWRKGDFEKADEQLQGALKLAEKIQDNWFEAECYNAIALIKTSTERTDEAIQAYKQAIHLAPDQIFAWNNLGNLCAKIGRNDEAMLAFRKAIDCNPRDPIAWNGLANLHFKLGYADDAIAAHRKAIQYMPSFAQPWSGLGDVYASIGRTDEALKAYHKAIELNKQYVTPWIRLGILFTKQERLREAIKAYQKALVLDSNNSAIWNELGTILVKSESLDEAEEAFTKAIELDRGCGWAYSNLAYTYTLQGKYKKTVSLFLRSIELLQNDKDKVISWNRLANVYRLLNDYDNAIAAYQMADRLEQGNAQSFSVQPPVQDKKPLSFGDSDEPIAMNGGLQVLDTMASQESSDSKEGSGKEQAGDSAVKPAPESADIRVVDAPSWIFRSNNEGTPKANNEADDNSHINIELPETRGAAMTNSAPLEARPAVPQVSGSDRAVTASPAENSAEVLDAARWNAKGNALFSNGVFEEAIHAYNEAIRLDPLFGEPYSNLALTYLTQGQYAEAILLYQKSINLLNSDSDKALSWNGLGNAYRCINDYANAIAAYQKAAEFDPTTAGMRDRADDFQVSYKPKNASAWNDLGELFFKTGALDESINAFTKAIELEPDAGQSYSNLARTLAAQGKYQEAVPLFQKSIELLPDNKDKAATWNSLGNAYRKLNDYDNAINAYQKAVVLADEGMDLLTRTRFSLLSNCYVNP